MNGARMIGCSVDEKKKNTATCGAVNDRLRRRRKRIEKESVRKSVKDGAFFSSMIRK